MPQANLDRQTVARAALRLLDRAGLDGLTVRKLAGELGVQAPALYWHFKNKEELLEEMATTVFLDAVRDSGWPHPDANWPEWAEQFGKRLREMLLRYRDGARMFSGRYLTDSSFYGSMEAALAHRCGILAARGDAVPEYDLLLHHWLRYRRAGRLSAAGKATQTLPAGRAGQARRQQTISARRPGRGAHVCGFRQTLRAGLAAHH